MFYSADNAKLLIDGNEIVASTAQIALGTNLSPRYLINQRHTNEYFPSNGIGGNLSFSYYLTGTDYFKSFITGQGETGIIDPYTDMYTDPISGNFGGLYFESGYLTSYSVSFTPNSPALAQANVAFFDYARGEFTPTYSLAPRDTEILNFKRASVEGEFASGVVSNFIGGTYNYESEVKPIYLMNETVPSNVSFGPKTVNLNFEIDNPTGYLPVSGSRAKIVVELKSSSLVTADSFGCSGVINSRNLATSPGDIVRQTINITQSNIFDDISVEEGFIGTVLSPNHQFVIKGTNLMFAEKVFFGEIDAGKLVYLSTTGISGVVPAAAYTNDIVVQGSSDSEVVGRPFIILDSDDQVKVGPVGPLCSGYAGDAFTITGENFYQITNVKFGEIESEAFEVVSPTEIQTTVPQNAPWDGVSVFSSLRTGLEGSITEASGRSYDEFVPFPEVTSVTPPQLASGEQVTIGGKSFGGATGLKLNSIEAPSFVGGTTSVAAIVPSGDTWGNVEIMLQSGLTYTAPTLPHNYISFKSLAKITGVGPPVGGASYPAAQDVDGVSAYVETGQLVAVSGKNFSQEILYGADNIDLNKQGYYMVNFGASDATGAFDWVSDTLLTGVLPKQTPTGTSVPVVYSNRYPETYPSATEFTLKYSPPFIQSVEPASGLAGDNILLKGKNFYGITGVNLTGAGVGIGTYQTSSLVQNIEGTSVTMRVGENITAAGHQYFDVIVSGEYGDATKTNGFLGLGPPSVTSIDPTGLIAPNRTGIIVGTNLYPDTTVLLVKDSMTNVVASLSTSGYNANFTQTKFTYPNTFTRGQYKTRVRNRRNTILYNKLLGVYHAPEISGFEPTSVTSNLETVTVSGFFEGVTGVSIGDVSIPDFTAHETADSPSTMIKEISGVTFKAKDNVISERIKILTSGGTAESSLGLDVIPAVPTVSGFWVGKDTDRSNLVDYNQVFAAGNDITISGAGLDLVNQIQFTGWSKGNVGVSERVSLDIFTAHDYDTITMPVPEGIHPSSGFFDLIDYMDRKASFNLVGIGTVASPVRTGINLFTFSGADNNLLPGARMEASGVNMADLNVIFYDISGNPVYADNVASTQANVGVGALVDTITVNVPTGIVNFPVTFSGRSNNDIYTTTTNFEPLSAISGVSGYNAAGTETGTNLIITGVNFQTRDYLPYRGDLVVGISGTGYRNAVTGERLDFYAIAASGYQTGLLGTNQEYVSLIKFTLDNAFIGTGLLFTLNGWEPEMALGGYTMIANNFVGSVSEDFLPTQISYHPVPYDITGTWVDATGFGPTMGLPGDEIKITGYGLNEIGAVVFSTPDDDEGSILTSAPFVIDSNNKITVTVPETAIEQRTDATILLSGGTNDEIGPFSVLVDSPGFVSDVIDTAGEAPRVLDNQVVRYSVDEFVNGFRYIVTYDKYPDGTLVKISSVPVGGISP